MSRSRLIVPVLYRGANWSLAWVIALIFGLCVWGGGGFAQPSPPLTRPSVGPLRPVPVMPGRLVPRSPIRLLPVRSQPARVIGTLFAVGRSAINTVAAGPILQIELPDVSVSLRTPGGAVAATSTTILDGSFVIVAPRPGIYLVCWTVAGQTGCDTTVKVGGSTVRAGRIAVHPERQPLFGTVLTLDGRACWMADSFFGLDVSTKVSASGALSSSARANTQGEYALFGLPPGRYRVDASCEKAEVSGRAAIGNIPPRLNLILPNHAPRLTGNNVDTGAGARASLRAAPGSSVLLRTTATDRDNDRIEYLWRTTETDGVLDGSVGNQQKWALPPEPGLRTTYLMARDGRGGFAYRRILVDAGPLVIGFSGTVLDELTRVPLPNAEVSVGGVRAHTNVQGWFNLTAPPVADDRYVLNITGAGYARLSHVYDRGSGGNTYEMIRAQVDKLPPGGVLTIDDKTGSGCARPAGDKVSRLLRRASTTIWRDEFVTADRSDANDKRLLAAAQRFDKQCDRRGVQLVIPAGGLVDTNGKVPAGAITSSSATLNPARRAIPGDYQAVTAGGDRAELLSFGATYAEFKDSGGNKLNLRPGTMAEVRIPVPPSQLADAKPMIALWSYDDVRGRWIEEGQATLTTLPAGLFYVGKVKHFSEINMDVAGTDPAFATCVRFELDPGAFAGWSGLVMRGYVSYGGNSVQVKETALDGRQYNVFYRIPFGTGFPNTLRIEIRGTAGGQQVTLLDNIINTDARPKMTGTNLWPPYPYDECGASITLTTAPGVVPQYGDLDGAGRPAFLSGPFGDFNPPGGEALATAYYAAIDPAGAKTTLGDWWDQNGFGSDGLGAGVTLDPSFTRAAYLNHNDLGFGRDMHCVKTGANLACYVTNYGLPDQNPQNADDALNHVNPAATVTMEYNAAAPAAERVQFYVYGAGAARTSQRLKFADLDGFGPKPVPYLCTVCHGGTVNAASKASKSRFREFDLPSFRYSAGRSWDYPPAAASNNLSNAELTAFARLNQMVRDTTTGKPIANLINNWYPGGFGGSPKPVLPAPPTGWAGDANNYHNVYGKTCRTCHVARDEDAAGADPGLTFSDRADLVSTAFYVCEQPRRMPNAIVTYKNFWADTPTVNLYEVLTGTTVDTCRN